MTEAQKTWVDALQQREIWDIGQLPKGVKALFRRMAKRGEIEEGRGYWCYIGSPRFYWRALP